MARTNIPKRRKEISDFTLMDDTFFNVCFQDSPECVKLMLDVILKTCTAIKNFSVQKTVKRIDGRAVIFDIKIEDAKGRHYDVEIQRSNEGAAPMRARYNLALMDASFKEPGRYAKNLPETFVIFITENDYWGEGEATYSFDRKCRTGKNKELIFGDLSHIIYVNGKYRGNDKIGDLMSDFSCKEAGEIKNRVLRERVRYYKENEQGVRTMCKVMDRIVKEEVKERDEEIVLNLLRKNMSIADITDVMGLSESQVKKIQQKVLVEA